MSGVNAEETSMPSDLVILFDWIVEESRIRRPVEESMAALIDYCEDRQPHPDWALFRDLHYGDLSALTSWLSKTFSAKPSKTILRGLWFGLFNPCLDDGTPVADIYVSGSKRYCADPRSNEWAVGPDWWPRSRYAKSSILEAIYRIANPSDPEQTSTSKNLCAEAEYALCLGYGTFAAQAILLEMEPALILGGSETLGVAVGFDSGDFVLLGDVDSTGLSTFETPADIRKEIEESKRVAKAVTIAVLQAVPDGKEIEASLLADGTVILSGDVPSEEAMSQAEQAARTAANGREIYNCLMF